MVGQGLQVRAPALVLPQELGDEGAPSLEVACTRRVEQLGEVDVELGQSRSTGDLRTVVDLAEGGVALVEVEQPPRARRGDPRGRRL